MDKEVQLQEVIIDPNKPLIESNQVLQGMTYEEISAEEAAKIVAKIKGENHE